MRILKTHCNILSGRDVKILNVANKSKLRERVLVDVEIDYKRIVLAIIEGKVYLMNAVCSTHSKCTPLEEGTNLRNDNSTDGFQRYLYITSPSICRIPL